MGKPTLLAKAFIMMSFLLSQTMAVTAATQDEEESARWYEIEIILFEYSNPQNIESERWPAEHAMPDLGNAIDLFPEQQPDVTPGTTRNSATSTATTPTDATSQIALQPSVHTTAGDTTTLAYIPLSKEELRLGDMYRAIGRSRNRIPLMHVGWRQPTVDKAEAIPVHIHGGKKFTPTDSQLLLTLIEESSSVSRTGAADSNQEIDTTIPEQAATDTSRQNNLVTRETGIVTNDEDGMSTVDQLNGTITISRARYLHVWTDLVFTTDQVPSEWLTTAEDINGVEASVGGTGVLNSLKEIITPRSEQPANLSTIPTTTDSSLFSLRIQDHRRMRSKEVHYLDHPLLGMIILATPYEPPPEQPLHEQDTAGENTATSLEPPQERVAPNTKIEQQSPQ